MLIARSIRSGAAGRTSFAGKVLSAVFLAVMSGAACAANPGDEVSFKEGEPMPPAPAGMSWCLVQKPAVYETVTETVMVRPKANFQVPVPGEYADRTEVVPAVPAYRVGTIVPAKLETRSMPYVRQEAYEALEVVPPEFTDVMEEVEVCPAYEQITIIPARFRETSKRMMVEPTKKSFKRDTCKTGLLCWSVCETEARYIDVPTRELVADATEKRTIVPARTEKVMVRKLAKPAQIRRAVIPAETTTYRANVVTAEAKVEWRTIPVENRNVTVQVETKAPSFVSQSLPEKTENISRRILVTPEQLVWRLEAGSAAVVPAQSCYETGSPCAVARQAPQKVVHACSW